MMWRSLTIAGLLHGAAALALLGLMRTHLPRPPPDAPVITVVMQTVPQAKPDPSAAKAIAVTLPLPLPPPPVPVPERMALHVVRQEAHERAMPPEVQHPVHLMARDVGEQAVAVTRPAVADADNAAPVYTIFERELGEEGTVGLRIVVLPDGVPGSVTVVKSSGFRVLDVAAQKAVMGWHFQPALRHGTAVAFTLPYAIAFVLQ